jgi:hypothetical protein
MAFQFPLALLHHPHLDMAAKLNLDSLAGALGSIIGYLGAEAAQPYLFERLLWPQILQLSHAGQPSPDSRLDAHGRLASPCGVGNLWIGFIRKGSTRVYSAGTCWTLPSIRTLHSVSKYTATLERFGRRSVQ